MNITITVDLSDRAEAILKRVLKSVSSQAAVPPGGTYRPVRNFDDIDDNVATPAPVQDVPDEQLRTIVNDATKVVPARLIRDTFKEFGISTSVECPKDKRVYLIRAIDKLVEEWKDQ